MTSVQKIILALIFLLIGAFIIEAVFYFSSSTQVKTAPSLLLPTYTPPLTVKPSVQPTLTPRKIVPTSIPNPNQLINASALASLKSLKKALVQSLILTEEYQGKISIVSNKAGTTQSGFKYVFLLRIANNNQQNTFIYNQSDLGKTSFVELVSGKENPIKQTDLKIGDTIKIQTTEDLIKPLQDMTISNKIIKI